MTGRYFPSWVEADAAAAQSTADTGTEFLRAGRETGSPPPAP
jgi:hypothetical protein